MTHVAIQESLNGKGVDWMEKVTDEQYGNFRSTSMAVGADTKEPAGARELFADFDPKLAEITDNVLFADVWERPGLSKHDRSLITVAAVIALIARNSCDLTFRRARMG